MLSLLLRKWLTQPCALMCLVLFFYPTAYASEEDAEPVQDATPLSLDGDVELPVGLWPNAAAPAAPEVPSMTLSPPPPLAPPPLTHLTLMLDWYLSPQHAALIVAQESGYFTAQDLAVELMTPADPTIGVKLLAAGEVDLALTRQPILHLYAHDGAPIARIGTLFETPLTAVIATGEAPVRGHDPKDTLATLNYGYSTREGRSIIAQQLIPDSLRQTDDFTPPVNVHFDAADALRDGDVAAITDGYYHYLPAQLAPNGISTYVVRYHELDIPRHDGLVVVANRDAASRQSATWSRLLIAIEEASHWIVDHPDEAWTLISTAHPVLDNDINAAAWEDIVRRMTLRPAAVDSRHYAAFETFLQRAGIVDETLPVSRLALDPHAFDPDAS